MDNDSFIPPVVNPTKSRMPNFSGKILMVIIGVVVAVVIGMGLMIISSANNPTDRLDQLNARLNSLQQVVDIGKKRASHPDLKKIVSDASILLVNDINVVTTTTTTAGASGSNKEVMAREEVTELLQRLETAAINGQFDQVYLPEIIDKYESTIRLLDTINRSTGSAGLRSATQVAKDNCETIVKQLQALTL